MSESSAPRVLIHAPAKLNLGLEVIGRREDGFHDIATIFLAVDLYDQLRMRPSSDLELRVDDANLIGSDNLALRALHALRDAAKYKCGAHIDLRKGIPVAAGLGGASSDAAAALLGARRLWNLTITDDALRGLAADLGSDVPFFLHGECAIGRGRGDLLTPLPVPQGMWFVVVVPTIAIPKKTASLYASLEAHDFSEGERIAAQAARIASGLPLDADLLGNAFSRPLYTLAPECTALPSIMRDAGAASVAISGAGPAHYAPMPDKEQADEVVARLRQKLGRGARIVRVAATTKPAGTSRPL